MLIMLNKIRSSRDKTLIYAQHQEEKYRDNFEEGPHIVCFYLKDYRVTGYVMLKHKKLIKNITFQILKDLAV